MVKSNFYVRKIDAQNQNQIFDKLYLETQKSNNSDLTLYVPELVQCNHQTYAFFRQRYDLIATRFEIADEVFYFADDEENEFEYLTVDEINLLRDMGRINIDGVDYKIADTTFSIIDTAIGAQKLFTFKLEEDKHNDKS